MSVKRRQWWWAVLLLLVVVGIARLKFDIEVLNLLPSDLPAVEGLKLHQRHFSNADELIITLSAGDAEQAANTARDLALALRGQPNLVARALWQSPGQEHPEQMPELLALMWLNQPPERFNELAGRLATRGRQAGKNAVCIGQARTGEYFVPGKITRRHRAGGAVSTIVNGSTGARCGAELNEVDTQTRIGDRTHVRNVHATATVEVAQQQS